MKSPVRFVPLTPAGEIDWASLEANYPCFAEMAKTPQNSCHHAEGDVLTHTKMVAAEAQTLAKRNSLSQEDADVLVGAALFHDCGKPLTLTFENGAPSSPQHAAVGTRYLRHFWWHRGWFPEERRELLLSLVRSHAAPVRLFDPRHEPEYRVIETSWASRNDLLALLAEADMRGRICVEVSGQAAAIETAQAFAEYAREIHCFDTPRPFANGLARFHYFDTQGKSGPDYVPFDDSKGEVILMSGLPGSGKNTWVTKNAGELPAVELDAVRAELGVSPQDDQGQVVQTAKERARDLMRKRAPRFVWNSTNLRLDLRRQLIGLFTSYGYRVRIVYCPADRPVVVSRNQKRENSVRVPVSALDHMGAKLEPPRFTEAHDLVVAQEAPGAAFS